MFTPITLLAMFGSMVAHTSASLCFSLAAGQKRHAAFWIFVLGNVIGFFNPFCMSIALGGNNPSIIFAIVSGGTGILMVFTFNFVFKQRLAWFQWVSIAFLIAGVVLLSLSGFGTAQ